MTLAQTVVLKNVPLRHVDAPRRWEPRPAAEKALEEVDRRCPIMRNIQAAPLQHRLAAPHLTGVGPLPLKQPTVALPLQPHRLKRRVGKLPHQLLKAHQLPVQKVEALTVGHP